MEMKIILENHIIKATVLDNSNHFLALSDVWESNYWDKE
jgi:hypothetical protein